MSPGAIVAHWRAENPSDCDSTMQEDDLEVPRSFSGADVVMEEDIEATPFDEGVDANEDTTVVEEHAYDSHQHQLDVAAQQEEADLHAERLREAGWNEDGIAVHRKIIMRGYEPLMPSHWHLDFPTIPSALFTADNDLSFINTTKGNDFRGKPTACMLMNYVMTCPNSYSCSEQAHGAGPSCTRQQRQRRDLEARYPEVHPLDEN